MARRRKSEKAKGPSLHVLVETGHEGRFRIKPCDFDRRYNRGIKISQEDIDVLQTSGKMRFELKLDQEGFLSPDYRENIKPGDVFYANIEKGQLVEITDVLGNIDGKNSNDLIKFLSIKAHKGLKGTEKSGLSVGFSDEKGLYNIWPREVIEEVENIEMPNLKDLKGYKDWRHVNFIATDPEGAKDKDDAVYAAELGNGNILKMTAIADVSAFVKSGGASDIEAKKRATSYYIGNSVIPMLHEKLSNNYCSLHDGEDKLSLVRVAEYDLEGNEIGKAYFTPAIINVKANFNYEQMQKIYEGKLKTEPKIKKVVDTLYKAAATYQVKLNRNNALDIDSADYRWVFDKEGNPIGKKAKNKFKSNEVIRNNALSANEDAAIMLKNSDVPAIYRNQDKPKHLRRLATILRKNNITLKGYEDREDGVPTIDEISTPEIFNKTMQELKVLRLKDNKLDKELNYIARCQRRAIYSTQCLGHFNLQIDYTHFTSPIRRLVDLVVHRSIKTYLGDQNGNGLSSEDKRDMQKCISVANKAGREAKKIDEDLNNRLKVKMAAKKLNKVFNARVERINGSGVFVDIGDDTEAFIPAKSFRKIIGKLGYCKEKDNKHFYMEESGEKVLYKGSKVRLQVKFVEPASSTIVAKAVKPLPLRLADKFNGKIHYTLRQLCLKRKRNHKTQSSVCACN